MKPKPSWLVNPSPKKCFLPGFHLSILGANLELGRNAEEGEIRNLPLLFASCYSEHFSSLSLIFLICKMGTTCFLDVKTHFSFWLCFHLFEAGHFSPSVPNIPLICFSCKIVSVKRDSWVYIWQDESWGGSWSSGCFQPLAFRLVMPESAPWESQGIVIVSPHYGSRCGLWVHFRHPGISRAPRCSTHSCWEHETPTVLRSTLCAF